MPLGRGGVFRIMDTMFQEIIESRERTGKAYAPNKANPFENFIRAAQRKGSTKETELWNQAYKHIVAIEMWITATPEQRLEMDDREPIEKRINDLVTYAGILRAMIEEPRLDAHVEEYGIAGAEQFGPGLVLPKATVESDPEAPYGRLPSGRPRDELDHP